MPAIAGLGDADVVAVGTLSTPNTARARKAAESLARSLAADIAERGLEPGDSLPDEAAMIEQYQVARGTVREALRILEVQGVVRIRRGRGGGPTVCDTASVVSHFAEMAKLAFQMLNVTKSDLLEARTALEPVAARIAAERGGEALKRTLTGLVDVAERLDEGDELGYAQFVSAFYKMILSASGNPVLDLVGLALQDPFDTEFRAAHGRPTGDLISKEAALEAQRAIVEAIIEGRGEDAEALMSAHMRAAMELVPKLADGGMDEPVLWD